MAYRKVAVREIANSIKIPWSPVRLGGVEDYDVKTVIFEGNYTMHKHIYHDEFIYVFDGKITIDFEDRELHLNEGEGVFIEKGTFHKSKCDEKATVLLFEKHSIINDKVDAK